MTRGELRYEMEKMDRHDADNRARNSHNYSQKIKNLITLIASIHGGSNEWPAEVSGGMGYEDYLIDISDGNATSHDPHTVYFGGGFTLEEAKEAYKYDARFLAKDGGYYDQFECSCVDDCECTSSEKDAFAIKAYLDDCVSFTEIDEASYMDDLHSEWQTRHCSVSTYEFCKENAETDNDAEIVAPLLLRFCRNYGAKLGLKTIERNKRRLLEGVK